MFSRSSKIIAPCPIGNNEQGARKEESVVIKSERVKESIPIHLKALLTIREAALYSNIGINRIDSLLRSPNCPFVLFVGSKKLVKRKEFEQFISNKLMI
ncbi:MAG: hypothetical protein IJF25_06230 [Oscillospiraceae bacterium]|nr:hypothetical protein [Oscillospiraceae bacterium]